MPGIIGRKIGMTAIFNEDGKSIPCTLIEAGPCVVTQIKNKESDGYRAVQLAWGEKKEKRTSKAMKGHFKKAGTSPKKHLVEFRDFRAEFDELLEIGKEIKVEDIFEENDYVDLSGTSKGKGFQGVVKRYNFKGVGDATHGQHNRLRAPGSIGGSSFPSRVFKGTRMAGRTGGKKTTILNLRVVKIVPEKNLILVSGPIPGSKNSTVILEK